MPADAAPPEHGPQHAPGTAAASDATALTEQLSLVWASIANACDGLGGAGWDTPTACPGWTVADQVAHIIGTESMLAGRPSPEPAVDERPHVRNDIGRFNEAWLDRYRSRGTAELLTDLRHVVEERRYQLQAMTEADLDRPSWTPVGQATYRRFMQVRVFDCWVHEQDIRVALDRPGDLDGPAAEQALDELVRALGLLVGKRAGAPQGSLVRFDLRGPLVRTVDVAVSGRATVVASGSAPPTATLQLRSDTLLRVACGRRPPADVLDQGEVVLSGARDLGRQVLRHLPFTI